MNERKEGIVKFSSAIRNLELETVLRPREVITPDEAKSMFRRRNGIITKVTTEERINNLERENKLLRDENTKLKRMLLTDEMTGLGNQRKYEYDTKMIISRYLREQDDYKKGSGKKPNGIEFIVIDGNDLKKINDTLGHGLGDVAIKRLGTAILKTIRAYDFAYRKGSGADEFVIILETDKLSSQKLVKRITEELRKINFGESIKNKENMLRFNLTFAEGIARIDEVMNKKLKGYTPEILERKLFELAEKRMYERKREMKKIIN